MKRRTLLGALPLSACSPRPTLERLDVQWVGPDPARGHRLRETAGTAPGAARTRRTQVLVVGGGVAGLSCARALAQRGIDFALLELHTQAGGNSQGLQLGGLHAPLGAHYLPQPGPQLPELQDLLVELGAAERLHGRWQAKPEHTVHAPHERRFDGQAWQQGLLPIPASAEAQAQQRRFAAEVAAAQRLGFAIPTHRAPFGAAHRALDAQTFDAWLDARGLRDPALRWYLDYACRDDYGAGSAQVSAWAGLHYFASRHGFQADEAEGAPPQFTWPQGNGWLCERLAAPLQDRIALNRVALQLDEERQGVRLRCWSPEGLEDWQAQQAVLAVPLFVAQRLWRQPSSALQAVRLARAPWLVSNLLLDRPPLDRVGVPLAWDNVVQGAQSLGYVNARQQSLDPRPDPQLWTHYWALPLDARPSLLQDGATAWAERVLAELRPLHPDLDERLLALRLTRHGHAMAVPLPGARSQAALQALRETRQGRVRFAHADLAAYSVFEEAFMAGLAAADGLVRA